MVMEAELLLIRLNVPNYKRDYLLERTLKRQEMIRNQNKRARVCHGRVE